MNGIGRPQSLTSTWQLPVYRPNERKTDMLDIAGMYLGVCLGVVTLSEAYQLGHRFEFMMSAESADRI